MRPCFRGRHLRTKQELRPRENFAFFASVPSVCAPKVFSSFGLPLASEREKGKEEKRKLGEREDFVSLSFGLVKRGGAGVTDFFN